MEIQLRSETTGMKFVESFKDAFIACSQDATYWKISFSCENDVARYRLLRHDDNTWSNHPFVYNKAKITYTQLFKKYKDNMDEFNQALNNIPQDDLQGHVSDDETPIRDDIKMLLIDVGFIIN